MQFRVGPWIYRVWVSREPLLDAEGDPLLGQARYGSREILISSGVRPEHRLDILLHELRHCWLFHFPRPRTEEEDCNFSSAVMAQAAADLEQQGGLAGLQRLLPVDLGKLGEESSARSALIELALHGSHKSQSDPGPRRAPAGYIDSADTEAQPHGGRAQCGVCETVVAAGMIITDRPRWSVLHGGMVVHRVLYCPHCNHLQNWTEGADIAACPNGSVAAGPTYQRGPAVEEFLANHPQAAGMVAE